MALMMLSFTPASFNWIRSWVPVLKLVVEVPILLRMISSESPAFLHLDDVGVGEHGAGGGTAIRRTVGGEGGAGTRLGFVDAGVAADVGGGFSTFFEGHVLAFHPHQDGGGCDRGGYTGAAHVAFALFGVARKGMVRPSGRRTESMLSSSAPARPKRRLVSTLVTRPRATAPFGMTT